MVTKETESDRWDYDQLIKYGAARDFVEELSPNEAQELLKCILYAVERHKTDLME